MASNKLVPLSHATIVVPRAQDGVGAEREAVTLGEDPYSDYSLPANNQIFLGYPPAQGPSASQGQNPPEQLAAATTAQPAEFECSAILDDITAASSDLTDFIPESVFEEEAGEDGPCDPYYF